MFTSACVYLNFTAYWESRQLWTTFYSIIRFPCAKRVEIHHQIREVNGWHGMEMGKNYPRWPHERTCWGARGRPSVITDDSVQKVDENVKEIVTERVAVSVKAGGKLL